MYPAAPIKIKLLQLSFLQDRLVEFDDRLNALVLAFTDGSMQGGPVIIIRLIDTSPVRHEQLSYKGAFLRDLVEQIHHEMKRRLAFAVSLVDVGSSFDQGLDKPDF